MWKEILTLVGIPIVRSFAGWAENAFKDGVITPVEWKKLGETVLRVGIVGFATYFGLNEAGVDISAFGAGASAVVMDFLFMALKKKK